MTRNELLIKKQIMAKKKAKKRAIKEKFKKLIMIGTLVTPIIVMAKAGLLNDTPGQYKIPEGAQSWGTIQENGKDRYEVFYQNGQKYKLDLHNGAYIPLQIGEL